MLSTTSAVVLIVLASFADCWPRSKREAEIATAETRLDPYLYDRQIGYSGDGFNGPRHLYQDPYGYGGGYLRSGINDGSVLLGNKGEQIYRHESDGGFLDNNYRAGGALHQGGFKAGEGYKDNKHHVADDFSNTAFHNGVQGARKDIGNGQVFDKNQGFSENTFNKLGDRQEKDHQKGHHRTGFHKSYHKDESGNDESYYDSDHDTGSHEYGKQHVDEFGNSYRNGAKGGENVNEFSANERGHNGYEGNGKLIAHNQGYKDRFGNNAYYDDGSRYGKYGGGQSSQIGKIGYQNDLQNGFNNGRHLEGSRFGYGPYGY